MPLLRSFGVPPERIVVLPSLYIDLETFAPSPPSDGPAAPAQDLLFVGRLVANKGLDRIVEALRLLRERGRPRSALFIGKGPLAGWLERRIASAGLGGLARRVEWVDGPAELARHYRASRALVCASSCEGGPRVTVEAMACGTPCVSTRVGMMNELLVEGENGVFCGFDAPSLADAVDRLLGDEEGRVRMGRAARRAAQGFEREATIRRYAEGLQALARGEAPA